MLQLGRKRLGLCWFSSGKPPAHYANRFSGVQHLEFDFNKFNDREDILSALAVLRHVSGITRIGGAFEFTLNKLTPEFVGPF